MAGWKGWADFAPMTGSDMQQAETWIQYDDLNEVDSLTPSAGSMRGGAMVTISGKGFKLPGSSNDVVLVYHGGTLKGRIAGMCNVTEGTLSSLTCQMPTFDLSHWSSTQFEERIEIHVNGQLYYSSGGVVLFTYSRPRTPIVQQVVPP
ncbi:unnamed protein product, partial [Effrenium voratum]